ncbi:MAG: hypothetical protein JJ858_18785 [Rhizobiaceae bacterium]|nr:hypothetical protein [Rhizobiaceae bacterium]
MSNRKQIDRDNILQFRLRGQSRPQSTQTPCRELGHTSSSQNTASNQQPSRMPVQNYELVRLLTSKGNPTVELVDIRAPAIVRRVLRHVRKRSRSNNQLPRTLPRALSRELQLLCDFDHPAGIVLRDWFDGKLHALPDGFEETYARASNMKEIHHD